MVLLPLPLGPTMAWMRPRKKSAFTSRSTSRPSWETRRPRRESTTSSGPVLTGRAAW